MQAILSSLELAESCFLVNRKQRLSQASSKQAYQQKKTRRKATVRFASSGTKEQGSSQRKAEKGVLAHQRKGKREGTQKKPSAFACSQGKAEPPQHARQPATTPTSRKQESGGQAVRRRAAERQATMRGRRVV